ncbi:hypothetical protein BDW66DRAFT_95566 [Aspergillus desertorum]
MALSETPKNEVSLDDPTEKVYIKADETRSDQGLHKKIAIKRSLDRQEIEHIFKGSEPNTRAGRRPPVFDPRKISLQDHPTASRLLYGPIRRFAVPKNWKTIAVLERGGDFPPVEAMSGQGHKDVELWTDRVLQLTARVNRILIVVDDKDQGQPGRFHVSHAEEKLIAYFVYHHVSPPGTCAKEMQSPLNPFIEKCRRSLSDK